ncbi:MAG: ABC transporter substrate-binding protein [Tissierellales bacterium]|nr:ABC transporter substrate-binding protein [Tissierellales bacterium]
MPSRPTILGSSGGVKRSGSFGTLAVSSFRSSSSNRSRSDSIFFCSISILSRSDNCDYPWKKECAEYCATQAISLGYRSFSNSLIYIAWRKGFFIDEGLDIAVTYFENESDVINNIADHKLDKPMFGLVDPTMVAWEIKKGYSLKNICAIENELPYVIIGPGKISSFTDLKGMEVAVPIALKEKPSLYSALEMKGIKISTFPLPFSLSPENVFMMLESVHANYKAIPFEVIPIVEKAGLYPLMSFNSLIPNFINSTIIINAKDAYRFQDAYINFSSAILKASRFFYQNKKETIAIVTKELAPIKFTKEMVENIYNYYNNNKIFSVDGIITPKEFDNLKVGLNYNDAVDMTFIENAKVK